MKKPRKRRSTKVRAPAGTKVPRKRTPQQHAAWCAKMRAARAAASARRAKNPAAGARALYEEFHQKPSESVTEFVRTEHYHEHLAELGTLRLLGVELPDGRRRIFEFGKGKAAVMVCSAEDGGQIEFNGGDQEFLLSKLGLAGGLPKDRVKIGGVYQIVYHTQKGFHNFAPTNYEHFFGRGSTHKKPGARDTWPDLCYDVLSKLMFFVGGVYKVKREGIVN